MNDLFEPFIDIYWRNLLSTFRDQVFHDYYIPYLNQHDPNAFKERLQDDKVADFLTYVDGKRSLREISWFSGIDWNELTLMISGMINEGDIYLEISHSREQILYLTMEGLNVLLGKSDPPATIIDIWDEVGVVFLNEISPLLPMRKILYRMRNTVDFFGEEIIYGLLKELLHELLVKPYPSLYNLSNFLQSYYSVFYNHVNSKIGNMIDQNLLESIDVTGNLRVLYPSFDNSDTRTPEKM